MRNHPRKIVIIGGGIAGLCAAVYALKCGYEVEVLEMNDIAGGLAMSWRRGAYTFETCLHWLIGSNPRGEFHQQWKEVFDIDSLTFVNPHEFVRIENEEGNTLRLYTNADMLEAELVRRAPQDLDAITDFVRSVRALGRFRMLDPSGGLAANWLNVLRDLPIFPRLAKLGKMNGEEYWQLLCRSSSACFLLDWRCRQADRNRHGSIFGLDESAERGLLHRWLAGHDPPHHKKHCETRRENPL